jgi:SAM-dependent methyltransferase
MNYQAVEEQLKAGYRDVTSRYRQDDEIEVTTENHRRIAAVLQDLCASFDHPIHVLDVGCGTGRYFHCLTNVATLTGIDISEDMLEAARHPVCESEITVSEIRLMRANAYLSNEFAPGSFHLIYSLGMFGNGCPVTRELCNRFYEWLRPGGALYFDTVDVAGLPLAWRSRRRLRNLAWPLLPGRVRQRLDQRAGLHPFFGLSKPELEAIVAQTHFTDFRVESHVCKSPLWAGRHLECIARKGSSRATNPYKNGPPCE